MTTRRVVASEKTMPEKYDSFGPSPEKSDIAPAVPMSVIAKLLGFTFAMMVVPIGSYFATVNTIFGGNATFAGATAAIMANGVLIAYVVVAMREDQSEQQQQGEKAKEAKKDR